MAVQDLLKKCETGDGRERDAALQQLLDITRQPEPTDWGSVLDQGGMAILGRSAFEEGTSAETRGLALRCLNNILFLSEPTRQLFVDAGLPEKLLALMRTGDADGVFLSMRLMLVCSVNTTLDLNPYFEKNGLADVIAENLLRNPRDASQPSTMETLKLICTIGANAKYEFQMHRFASALTPVFEMLQKTTMISPLPGSIPSTPAALLVDCLFVIPLDAAPPEPGLDKLIDALDKLLPARWDEIHDSAKTKQAVYASVMPLMAVLLKIAKIALAKPRLAARLLPSDDDRKTVLGHGTTLPHRLIRLAADGMHAKLQTLASHLLFVLSDEDSEKLTENVGYGYGVGILQAVGAAATSLGSSQHQSGQTATVNTEPAAVNPITGQWLNREATVDTSELDNMTQEEKEREAERLFVLFERLRATGVVDVENPVAQAVASGRVEELADSSDEE